jgi:hypothetical protein
LIIGACTYVGDAWGIATSCSMDVSNVGRTRRSIYYDTLLGGVMVFVSPLLNASCSQMLTLYNNFENGSLLMGTY